MKWAVIFVMYITEVISTYPHNQCLKKEFCGDCVSTLAGCSWCESFGNNETSAHRCNTEANLKLAGCKRIITEDEKYITKEDKPFQDQETYQEAVQIKPQRVWLKIRPVPSGTIQSNVTVQFMMNKMLWSEKLSTLPVKGRSYKVPLRFRLAKNYPLDLYFLFDGSATMNSVKETFTTLISELVRQIKNVTTDYTFGFGSFQDKVILPFTSTAPQRLISPHLNAAPPFDFLHMMPLQRDGVLLQKRVKAAKHSANLDSPEGGLDAIMQILACQDQIGWRQTGRRIILVATDQFCHYAGDGRLAGLVEPNDEKCYLSASGEYETEDHTKFDYPSIGQIARKLQDKNTNIIFAVPSPQISKYRRLSNLLGSAMTSQLVVDASNIVELIKSNYEAISSKVELRNISSSSDIRVKYTSHGTGKIKCLGNTCENLAIGDEIEFKVEVQVNACPSPGESTKRSVTIKPVGLAESMVIDMEIICECTNCSAEVLNSKECSGNGTMECGACRCNDGRSGKLCECDRDEMTAIDDGITCKRDNNTLEVCSGQGICSCGQCQCEFRDEVKNQTYSGTFCECDDYSCPIVLGELCGGPDHGFCECGACHCEPDYTGEDCSCFLRNDTCISANNKICNGHGKCECGSCMCDSPYRPPLCEECPTCPGACSSNEPCVKCVLLEKGEYNEAQCKEKCSNVIVVDKLDDINATSCQFPDDECTVKFVIKAGIGDDSVVIEVLKDHVCPEEINILMIVLLVTGGVVVIGLILLVIIRVCMYLVDKREYAKFSNEMQNAKWAYEENPIFRAPTTTYQNPSFQSTVKPEPEEAKEPLE